MGLHTFSGWQRPILTDSGGYQVFSLGALRSVDDQGVTFRSHLDGTAIRFTPEDVVRWQQRLGVDIAMVLDECPPWPAEEATVAEATRRTIGWARRARTTWDSAKSAALFGIAQGGGFERLREQAIEELTSLDFAGYAIGGVSVGEPEADRRRIVEFTAPRLPVEKPRYLMGVGSPLDIVHAVRQGVDLFDCVLPTRNARHGVLYTSEGPMRIKNATFKRDSRPVEETCNCPGCRSVSRAFLHHLIRSGELTGTVLATLHNLHFYLDFVGQLREAIASGRTTLWADSFVHKYRKNE